MKASPAAGRTGRSFLDIARAGLVFEAIPAPLVRYRRHDANFTNDILENALGHQTVLDRLRVPLPVYQQPVVTQKRAVLRARLLSKTLGLLRQRDVPTACQALQAAVASDPRLMERPGAYFDLVAATLDWSPTQRPLDPTHLAYAEAVLVRLLSAAKHGSGDRSRGRTIRRWRHFTYTALAQLAYSGPGHSLQPATLFPPPVSWWPPARCSSTQHCSGD